MAKYKSIIITLFIILITNLIYAQAPVKYRSALVNYEKALHSNNTGVVESAIENLFLLKLYVPDLDYSNAAKRMKELSESNTVETIRRKAFIGHLYLTHPERFNWLDTENLEANVTMFDKMFDTIDLKSDQKY